MAAKNKLKRGGVAIAIGLLTVLFIALFVDAVYDEPEYEEFCEKTEYAPRPVIPPAQNISCGEVDQEAVDDCYQREGRPEWEYDEDGCRQFKECNMCYKDLEEARKYVHRNAFYLGAGISLAAVIAGIFWTVEFIGMGFMLGGIIGLFYSTVRYFSDMDKWLRVIVIFVELCIVLAITYLKLVGKESVGKKSHRPKRKPKTRFKGRKKNKKKNKEKKA